MKVIILIQWCTGPQFCTKPSIWKTSLWVGFVVVILLQCPYFRLQCPYAEEIPTTCKEEFQHEAQARCILILQEPFSDCHDSVSKALPCPERKLWSFWRNLHTGCRVSCHFDKFYCSQWIKFCQDDRLCSSWIFRSDHTEVGDESRYT